MNESLCLSCLDFFSQYGPRVIKGQGPGLVNGLWAERKTTRVFKFAKAAAASVLRGLGHRLFEKLCTTCAHGSDDAHYLYSSRRQERTSCGWTRLLICD